MLQPIGIYKGELFLKEDNHSNMCVLRYMTKEDLEYWRSYEGVKEFVEDIWREDVYNNGVTCSLDEYVEIVMNNEIIDDEDFVGKDDSWCCVFDYYDNLRTLVDKFILDEYDEEVGTWEASGCYTPKAKFEFVINEKLAEEYYKANGID